MFCEWMRCTNEVTRLSEVVSDGDVERVVARRGIRGIRIDRQAVVHVAQPEAVV